MELKKQNIFESIGSIQYKNRDDWNTIKESVKNLPFEDGSMMDESYKLFKNIIRTYIKTLTIPHLGKERYNDHQNALKELEKKYGYPITTPYEEKLYNRLYRSLYWGYLIKERIITY